MNRIYGSCTGLLACLLLCTCAGQEPLAPDGLIRLGTRAGGYEGSATRASVNDLAGLAAVGDKALAAVPKEKRDCVRAAILKQVLILQV